MTNRSEILENLGKAVSGKVKTEIPVPEVSFFPPLGESLTESFKSRLEEVNGKVTIAENAGDLASALSTLIKDRGWKEIVCPEKKIRQFLNDQHVNFIYHEDLSENAEAVITGCEYLVAGVGSVIVSSAQSGSRRVFVFPPVHLVVAQSSQLVETLDEGFEKTLSKYTDHLPSLISIITGPSRTADIEKTLVLGAHGPKILHVFIVNTDIFAK